MQECDCDERIHINTTALPCVFNANSIASVFRDQRSKTSLFCHVSRISMYDQDHGTKRVFKFREDQKDWYRDLRVDIAQLGNTTTC